MKYNVPLYLDENNSLGKLLKKIKKGSTVLEFGCANGRMTRFMKEELNCNVYIVEYEFEAFREALNYAQDGICSDIMKFEWLEQFREVQFDYIIFADVLEHLSDPQKALKETRKVLKEDGRILISLPNVGHNDILINLYDYSFHYTSTGLLDDTHIHLFGKRNLKEFCQGAGYKIVAQDYTYCNTGESEQASGLDVPNELKKLLTFRQYGKVYQFVLELAKEENPALSVQEEAQEGIWHEIKIYYDRGNGYNEKDTKYIEDVSPQEGHFVSQFELTDLQEVEKLFVEPIQGTICIVKNVEITSETGEKFDYYCPDATVIGENEVILSYLPKVELDLAGKKVEKLQVGMEVIYDVKEVATWLSGGYVAGQKSMEQQKNEIAQLKQQVGELEARRETEKKLHDRIQKELWQVSGELTVQKEVVEELKLEKKELEEETAAHREQIQNILGSTSWKITKPFRYLMNTVRKIV